MAGFPPDTWIQWGNLLRDGTTLRSSRFYNHWTSHSNVPCCAQFAIPSERNSFIGEYHCIYGDDFTRLKFEICGGSDAPQFKLSLKHLPTEKTAIYCFASWTQEEPEEAALRIPSPYPGALVPGPHSFSMQLRDVVFNHEQYPAIVQARKPFGDNLPMSVAWNVSQQPTGYNTLLDTSNMPAASQQMFQLFSRCHEAWSVKLYVRGSHPFLESWQFFAAQPAPTPPHWWRYTTSVSQNQAIMKEMEPIDEGSELHNHHSKAIDPHIIVPMPAPTRFLGPREYEVFIIGSLFRLTEAKKKVYVDDYNGEYVVVLRATGHVDNTLESERTFVCTIQLHARENRPIDAPDLPPAPDVGTDVFLKEANEENEFAGTISAMDPANVATLIITRTKGSGAITMNDRLVDIKFGNSSATFREAQKCIARAMYFQLVPGVFTWLHHLLLAHENNLVLPQPPLLNQPWMALFPPLDIYQQQALARNATMGDTLADKISIIEGPPGTGKTKVIGMSAINCLSNNEKFMVVAETRHAVHVAADAIFAAMETAGLQGRRVFVIEHVGAEGVDYEVEEAFTGEGEVGFPGVPQPNAAEPEIEMSEAARAKIRVELNRRVGSKPESLTTYIEGRLLQFKETPESIPREERDLLRNFQFLRNILDDVTAEAELLVAANARHAKAFSGLQEYYIRHHAEGIIVTAATAMARLLRTFRPSTLLMDETSQLTEAAAVAVIARFFGRLRKVILLGDILQTSPFCDSEAELDLTTKQDIMTRLLATGVPKTTLLIQYRMHPHIAACVSRLFYRNQLINDASVNHRPADNIWNAFISRFTPECAGRHSVFLSIPPCSMYQPIRGASKINPAHTWMVRQIVANLRMRGAKDADIGIFTTYAAQLKLHRRMPNAGGISMSTIDGAQGKEFNFVILDLVTPGGRAHGLGFVADPKRMCVGISRAKNGMIIIGNMHMHDVPYVNLGARAWRSLIAHHRRVGGLAALSPTDANIQSELQRFGLGGNQYREIEANTT